MRVEKFEGKKEVVKTEYTERDLKAELNFYLSDKFIQDLFLLDEISLEEYRKIRRENIKKFRPILSELMPQDLIYTHLYGNIALREREVTRWKR